MPDTFMGIDIAARALRAFQMALNVTGHNLANVDTEGYSRQRIDIQQTPPITFFGMRPLTLGTGQFVNTVMRVRDQFLDGRYLQTNYEGSRLSQLSTSLGTIEGIYQEPGPNGLQNSLSAMFDAWSQLSANPADDAARLQVRLQSQLFVQRVHDINAQFAQYGKQLDGEVNATITQINSIAKQISDLNIQIRSLSVSGASPNDLMDQRDLAIQKLTDLVDVRTVDHLDGTKTVYVGSHTLVDQFGSYDLPSQYDANSSTVTDGTKVIQIKGGRLAGEFGGIVALGNYQSQLDSLVNSVRTQVNLLHETGINLNGTTGIDFFAGSVGAGDLDLSQEIKDDVRNIAAGTSGEPGDGTLASSIAGIRDLPDPNLGNRSVMDYYANTISQLGQESAYYQNGLQTQQAMLSQIEQQRQSVMGVNMDEELANMLKYQKSYQAAARFLTVLDQTTEDLISQFGR